MTMLYRHTQVTGKIAKRKLRKRANTVTRNRIHRHEHREKINANDWKSWSQLEVNHQRVHKQKTSRSSCLKIYKIRFVGGKET